MLAEKLKAMKEDQEGKTSRNKARPNNYKRKKKQTDKQIHIGGSIE